MLLTGDLEGDGLDKLLAQPAPAVDVLLSPHHGSPKSNPSRLADWAWPAYVVVSSGHERQLPALEERYGSPAQVLSTRNRGAVTLEIEPDGTLRQQCHLEQSGQ